MAGLLPNAETKAEMTVRVFLVEDMPQVQGALADLLASVGPFEVVGAVRTEAEARLWVQDHPGGWDLLVVDLVLDSGSGMGVIPGARAQANGHGGRVVVFSDYATAGIERHCRQLGAHAVFSKTDAMNEFLDYCAELGGAAFA